MKYKDLTIGDYFKPNSLESIWIRTQNKDYDIASSFSIGCPMYAFPPEMKITYVSSITFPTINCPIYCLGDEHDVPGINFPLGRQFLYTDYPGIAYFITVVYENLGLICNGPRIGETINLKDKYFNSCGLYHKILTIRPDELIIL